LSGPGDEPVGGLLKTAVVHLEEGGKRDASFLWVVMRQKACRHRTFGAKAIEVGIVFGEMNISHHG